MTAIQSHVSLPTRPGSSRAEAPRGSSRAVPGVRGGGPRAARRAGNRLLEPPGRSLRQLQPRGQGGRHALAPAAHGADPETRPGGAGLRGSEGRWDPAAATGFCSHFFLSKGTELLWFVVCNHVFIEHLLCARHRRHGRDGRDQSPLRPMGFAGRRTAAGRAGVYSLPRAWAAGPSSEPEPQPRVRRRLGRGSNGRNGEQGIPVGSRGRAGRVAGSSVRGAAGRHAHRRTSAPTELAAGSARPGRSPALGSRSPVCAGDADPRPTRVTRAHASAGARRSTKGCGIPPSRTAPSSTFTERPRRAVAGLQARFILLLNAAPLESGETGGGSVGAALVPTGLIQLGARAPRPPPRSAAAASRRVSVSLRVVCDFFFPLRVPRC